MRPQGGTAWTRFIMQRSQTTQQHLLKHMYSTAWRWEIISNLEPENLPFSLNLIWIHQPSESSTTERPQCLLCGGGAGCRRSVLLMCSHMMCILISLKLLQDSCHFLWSRGSNLLKREDEEDEGAYTEEVGEVSRGDDTQKPKKRWLHFSDRCDPRLPPANPPENGQRK